MKAVNFTFEDETEVNSACSTIFQDKSLVIGGKNYPNQVSEKNWSD